MALQELIQVNREPWLLVIVEEGQVNPCNCIVGLSWNFLCPVLPLLLRTPVGPGVRLEQFITAFCISSVGKGYQNKLVFGPLSLHRIYKKNNTKKNNYITSI